ncbi:DUF3326 domain-containing protein [bacterium]|nr:DUF3326 domain-containing protein [bacterium]
MKLGAFVVPTGVGASIGGFAGDASVWARRFAQKCKLIVNPNVVNAACFSGITDNMLYVEGYSLDEFFKGKLNLIPSENNKIGVIFDKSISQEVLNVHINTINAVKTVYGIDIVGYEITDNSVGVEFYVDKSGISTGNVSDLGTLKRAAEKLIHSGAEAIAIVCRFPEDEGNDYENGIGVDPVGGVEAIISHYISKEFQIPCAHAPAFDDISISSKIVDKRASAEYITPTFLPCILIGLSQAPKLVKEKTQNSISVSDLDFLIMPYNSLGGIPVFEANKLNKKIYAIKENKTILNVTPMEINTNCDIIRTYQELWELM